MPRKNSAEEYMLWMGRLQERERTLRDRTVEWNKYLRHYRMRLTEEEAPDGDNVWVNLHFALSRVILPSIYYKNPDILVRPRKDTPYFYALMLESLLNYQVEAIGFEQEMRRVVFDALFCGIGVMKYGYEPALRKQVERMDPITQQLMALTSGPGSLFEEEPLPEEESDEVLSEHVTPEDPFALRVSPRYFLMDPLATSDDQARWKCHIVVKPVKEVQASAVYARSLTRGIEGTFSLQEEHAWNEVPGGYSLVDTGSSLSRFPSAKSEPLVKLYEVWDRESGDLLVLDSYHIERGEHAFLRREKAPYDPKRSPLQTLVLNPDPDSPYGVPDAATWYNPINAMNLLRAMQYNHVKRFLRKYKSRRGAIKPEQMDNLQNGIDGAIVEIEGDPLTDGPFPIEDAPITGDLYRLTTDLRSDLNFLSGVTEQRRGESASRTATEASFIEQQAQLRDSDRLLLVAQFAQRGIETILFLDRKFLGPEYVSFITGPLSLGYWKREADNILKAQVEVKVRVGSTTFISREIRAKQLLDFLNLTAKIVDPMTQMPLVDVREVIRRVAEALEIDDYDALLLSPAPAPLPPGGPDQAGPPMAEGADRGLGNPSLGSLLSRVQNLGVRRTAERPQMAGITEE